MNTTSKVILSCLLLISLSTLGIESRMFLIPYKFSINDIERTTTKNPLEATSAPWQDFEEGKLMS